MRSGTRKLLIYAAVPRRAPWACHRRRVLPAPRSLVNLDGHAWWDSGRDRTFCWGFEGAQSPAGQAVVRTPEALGYPAPAGHKGVVTAERLPLGAPGEREDLASGPDAWGEPGFRRGGVRCGPTGAEGWPCAQRPGASVESRQESALAGCPPSAPS